jgi:oligopeptide/dipeptide ABC transporter ATP-binding protein
MAELLVIDDLDVRFLKDRGKVAHALNGLNLRVREGEVVGILGESGSGKSTMARALLRLLPKSTQTTGDIEFQGQKILQLTEREMNQIRGARIAMVPQEPGLALDPVMKIGDQVAELLHVHRDWNRQRCKTEAEHALARVGLQDSGRRFYDAYPHQLSGGQQQRAVIAQAVACAPALLIADEPTASLDSSTERQILDIFRELNNTQNTTLLFITHNPELLRNFADRIAILYAGRVVEARAGNEFFESPWHPYAKGLLACVPGDDVKHSLDRRLPTIGGVPPDVEILANGCSFAPRCKERLEKCENLRPAVQGMASGEDVECFLYDR